MQWNWEQIGAAALDFIIKYGGKLLLCLIIFIIGRIILKFLLKITNVAIKKTTVSEQAIKFVQAIIKVAFYIFIALAVLSIFGVPTTQFVALFSAVGLALSLAIKETLANFAQGVIMMFSKPFQIGDYIEANRIDILINNAGEYIYSHIEEIGINEIEHITRTNLEAPMYLISRAVHHMKKQKWGRIINIGSISGVRGEAGASLYSATKSGLIGATKALALELAEYGITVNTINPGWVDTDMGNTSANEGDFSKEEIVECIPQRRFVQPSEITGMVKYLISDEAKGVTGQSINLCAGLTCGC